VTPASRTARSLVIASLAVAACARSTTVSSSATAPMAAVSTSPTPPNPDPRVGLKAGWFDAGTASWNMRLVSNTRPSAKFINTSTPGDNRLTNSDIAFSRHYAIQGNYSGWQIWDVSNPAKPKLYTSYVCPGSQSDVSVFRNLLFVSGESTSGRLDCGLQGVQDSISHDRLRGIRIFDITELKSPKYVANVQTCRGSHTHTVVNDPDDKENVYVYISGSAGVRPHEELPGCSASPLADDPSSALFRIEVIKVPLAHPEQAKIVSSPRIFQDLTAPARHAETPADIAAAEARRAARGGGAGRAGGGGPPAVRGGPTQCHDITVYPAIGLAGGACGGYGLLLDIRDPEHPVRIGAAADSNFSFWHSATFSNDGSKVLFSDEWGGGTQPRCRVTDKYEWGADAIFTVSGNQMAFKSYYKMPAAQTPEENCVAHNGSLIPIPGREVMVQAWYQGGISVFDWTDPSHPQEIAFFDRGPMDATKPVGGGSWSVYWYNGLMYSSEIARGLDIFELQPSAYISQNEIDAAKTVRFEFLNIQDQQQFVWPPSFAMARAFVDQLERSTGLGAKVVVNGAAKNDKIDAVRAELARAEQASGDARRTILTQLATQLDGDAARSPDAAKVRMLASSVRDLAK
jgi:hypothetical protein